MAWGSFWLVIMALCGSSTYESGFGCLTCLTFVSLTMMYSPILSLVLLCFCWGGGFLVWFFVCFLFASASWRLISSNKDALDDRQCLTARSAKLKKSVRVMFNLSLSTRWSVTTLPSTVSSDLHIDLPRGALVSVPNSLSDVLFVCLVLNNGNLCLSWMMVKSCSW